MKTFRPVSLKEREERKDELFNYNELVLMGVPIELLDREIELRKEIDVQDADYNGNKEYWDLKDEHRKIGDKIVEMVEGHKEIGQILTEIEIWEEYCIFHTLTYGLDVTEENFEEKKAVRIPELKKRISQIQKGFSF